MAEDDIYKSKKRYLSFLTRLDDLCHPPSDAKSFYWIKNPENKKYYLKLARIFESQDLSYIRRLRLLRTLQIVTYCTPKDLGDIQSRDEIDEIMSFAHERNKSVKSKKGFISDLKHIWKKILPEKDERGRDDDTIVPYVVRHLSPKIDKSKETLREDKFSLEEYENLVQSFSHDTRMQCLLTLAFESLGRPQEILHRKLRDVELHDDYAKIYISSHGKEGTGFLRCVDSYFYLSRWLDQHPLKHDQDAYLFITLEKGQHRQFTPYAANKLIRGHLKKLGLSHRKITLYSLKRNAITMSRLRGDSDLDIQHRARWSSTKQLGTYDLSNQEESFKVELIKKGLIKGEDKYKDYRPKVKTCVFCNTKNGMTETFCSNCRRPLDREKIEEQERKKNEELSSLRNEMDEMKNLMKSVLTEVAPTQKMTFEEYQNQERERIEKIKKKI